MRKLVDIVLIDLTTAYDHLSRKRLFRKIDERKTTEMWYGRPSILYQHKL